MSTSQRDAFISELSAANILLRTNIDRNKMRHISDPVVLLQRLVSKSVALKLAFKCCIPNVALHPSVAIQVWLCLQVAALHYLSLPRLMERTIRVGKCAYVAQTQLRPFVTSERLLCNLVRAEAWWCTYAGHGGAHMPGMVVVHICWAR